MSFPSYSEYKVSGVEWLGDVPVDWEVRRLKNLVEEPLKYGANESAELDDRTLPRFVRITDIDDSGGLRDDTFKSLPEIVAEPYLLKQGDVLLARSGATVGKSFIYSTQWGPACFAGYLIRARLNQKVCLAQWLYYFCQTDGYWGYVIGSQIQATIQNVSAEKYANLYLPLPPLAEQAIIAAFLDRETAKIDGLVAEQKRLMELLKEKRQAVISHAVTKGLNPNAKMKPSGIEWLGDVPEGWEVRRLKNLVEEPLKYGANESAELDDRTLPRFVRITDIDDSGGLRDDTFKSLPEIVAEPYLLKQGDVLLARSGATVGKSFIYSTQWGPACFAGYLIRARLNQKVCLAQWLYYFCQTDGYWGYVIGSQIQATIQNVSAEKYANLYLPLPPLAEQTSIAAFLDRETARFDTLTAEAQRAIDLLQERRTALISAAVTGQIDVRNINNSQGV